MSFNYKGITTSSYIEATSNKGIATGNKGIGITTLALNWLCTLQVLLACTGLGGLFHVHVWGCLMAQKST